MITYPEALRLAEVSPYLEGGERGQWIIDAAAELRRLHLHEFANEVWQVKTQWVQDTAKPEELGMHRADVMRQRLERITAQRDALLVALIRCRNRFFPSDQPERDRDELWEPVNAAIKAVEGEKT